MSSDTYFRLYVYGMATIGLMLAAVFANALSQAGVFTSGEIDVLVDVLMIGLVITWASMIDFYLGLILSEDRTWGWIGFGLVALSVVIFTLMAADMNWRLQAVAAANGVLAANKILLKTRPVRSRIEQLEKRLEEVST